MRRDYINDNEPGLTAKEWTRYGIFAVVTDFLAAVLLGVRMAQVMLGPEIDWLREAVPPIADLFFLGLLIILSMKKARPKSRPAGWSSDYAARTAQAPDEQFITMILPLEGCFRR